MDATANESLTDMQIRQVGISEGNERDGNISSITDASEAAKLILLPEMLSLSKNDFLTKVDDFVLTQKFYDILETYSFTLPDGEGASRRV